VVKDIKGETVGTFSKPTTTKIDGPITIADGRFIKNDIVTLECVATNAIKGEALPEMLEVSEEEQSVEEKA
jgi:hypothetical protein